MANREMFFKMSWPKSMQNPQVLALSLVYFCFLTAFYGLNFFLPQIVKDFGLTSDEAGFVTAIPYIIGTIGTVHWRLHSDKNCERKWHVVVSFVAMVVGLGLASTSDGPIVKLAAICVAGWGCFSMLPVLWALPPAFCSAGRGRRCHHQLSRQSRRVFRAENLWAIARLDRDQFCRPDLPVSVCCCGDCCFAFGWPRCCA